tara:strand:+ start:200 stop:559 length:360 start_codon:yes stop_codon:yes gene_type:complete
MGRPINKRFFGAVGNNAQPTIAIRYHDGTASREGFILSQRGTNKFNCDSTAGTATVCRLVNETAPNAVGECSLVGYAPGGTAIILKKMFNRTAVDWSSNRYKWTVEDDSTESLIRLTAI